MSKKATIEAVEVPAGAITLNVDQQVPPGLQELVIFGHGSGSSRFIRRNRRVVQFLGERGYAALLLDLLTAHDEIINGQAAEYRVEWKIYSGIEESTRAHIAR